MNKELIKISNLDYSYKEKQVFTNFNLEIIRGSWTVITGSNSSGKTTLFKLISGLLPSENNIIIDGLTMNKFTKKDLRKKISVIFENLDDNFVVESVKDNLTFPLENLNVEVAKIKTKLIEISKFLKIEEILDKTVEELSKTEKLKVVLGICLMNDPVVILIDGGLFYLSGKERKEFLMVLNMINKTKKTTIIHFTNNLEDTYMSSQTILLNNGKIVKEGEPFQILTDEKSLKKTKIELPFMVELSLKLNLYELIDELILDMNKMVDVLWK